MKIPCPWPGVVLLALAFVPFAASAGPVACTGKAASLQSWAGKSLGDPGLFAAPEIAAHMQALPKKERLHLQRNLDVSGLIELDACHLVVSGNAPHRGAEEDAMLDVDLASGDVIAAIHSGGRIDIYSLAESVAGAPNWGALPQRVQEWTVKADMGFPFQPPHRLDQPRSVHFHAPPLSISNTAGKVATQSVKMQAVKVQDNIQPDRAQVAAIRRTARDVANCKYMDSDCYSVSLADLNDDGQPDLIVYYHSASEQGYCGNAGCGGVIVMATSNGYVDKAIELPSFNELNVLPDTHLGMHDLQFDRDSPVWNWSGKEYRIANKDLPGSAAPPWQARQATGHPLMAVATPIDSAIKNLLLFCEQGHPLLAMVTKMPLPEAPVTLTFVFRGWSVNVPMQPNPQTEMLWTADLSRSELPQWLAHRGTNTTTSELAGLATESFLRINGQMQGEISLEQSTQATQSALAACFRY